MQGELPIITEFRILQIEKDYCERKAVDFARKEESKLAKFYKNAAEGFYRRLQKMTVKQAIEAGRI